MDMGICCQTTKIIIMSLLNQKINNLEKSCKFRKKKFDKIDLISNFISFIDIFASEWTKKI